MKVVLTNGADFVLVELFNHFSSPKPKFNQADRKIAKIQVKLT